MSFNNNEFREPIHHVSTTAGQLHHEKCLARTLMQWHSLESHFLSNFNLDDNPTENDLDEEPSREKRLVNAFKQSVSHVRPVCNSSIDRFNTFRQAEEALIHILYHSTLRLYYSLLSRFILLEVISESGGVQCIDLEDPDVLKDFDNDQAMCKGQ